MNLMLDDACQLIVNILCDAAKKGIYITIHLQTHSLMYL